MNKYLIYLATISFFLASCNTEEKNSESANGNNSDSTQIKNNLDVVFNSDQEKQSYAFGVLQSRDLKQMYSNPQISGKVDRTEILAGIEDVLLDNDIAYSEEKANEVAKKYLTNEKPSMNDKKEASYCIGLIEGYYIKDFYQRDNVGVSIDYKFLFLGIKDALDKNSEPKINFADANYIISPIMKEFTEKKNKEFLVNNAKNDSVKVTESGLQYKVLKKGSGKSPKATDRVVVHYTGRLINGKVFDTSVKADAKANGIYNPKREPYEPIEFGLNEVIKGWTEGIQYMKEGAKYMFYIPSDIAYGPNGSGSIPGGATLIFEVELFKVK